ncbi:MAG: DEAD/DEAH box helicase [Methylobacter sp.]
MQITLTNKIHFTGLTGEQTALIVDHCTRPNPKFYEAQKQNRYTGNIPREICLAEITDSGVNVPIGLFNSLIKSSTRVIDRRNLHPVTIPFTGELRAYQETFVNDSLIAQQGVLVAATGAGKTVSAIALASKLGQRTLILVKSGDLAKQWQAAIKQFTGLDCGLIGGGKNFEGEQFTVGLVQSLCKRDLSLLSYGLVIADEAHNCPAAQSFTVINGLNARYKYGLSATPQRRDSMEFMIHAALGDVTATIEVSQLEGKVLPVAVKTYNVDFNADVETWGEFISALVDDAARNDLIVKLAHQSKPVIILCSQVRHCEILTTLAHEAGLKPLLIHGQLPAKLRLERMKSAQTARLIIGTSQLLSEGLDFPHLEVLIFAAPMSAVIDKAGDPAATKLIQSIGRCRRPHPGKTRALIIDLVDKCAFGVSAFNKRQHIYRLNGFGAV